MKPFPLFLAELNEGVHAAGLTVDLAALLAAVQNSGKAGDIVLKIKIAPATKNARGGEVDKVTITADRKLNLPKPEQPTDFYWLTDEADLSRNHPKQQSLQLQDVSSQPPLSTEQLKRAS